MPETLLVCLAELRHGGRGSRKHLLTADGGRCHLLLQAPSAWWAILLAATRFRPPPTASARASRPRPTTNLCRLQPHADGRGGVPWLP